MGTGRSPLAQGDQAVGAFAESVGQLDGDQGTRTSALPVAVRLQMLIDHLPNAEILQQGQEKRNAVDLFINDGSGGINLRKRIVPHHQPEVGLSFARMIR